MANEGKWTQLLPQAQDVESSILAKVSGKLGTPAQINYALTYLTRPHIPVDSAINVANGIILSETGSESINFIHIAKAYVSARINLALAGAQRKDVGELESKLASPYAHPNSKVTAFFISHYGLPLVAQMNASYRNEGFMDFTDPLIVLTEQIASEGRKYSKNKVQTMNQRRQEGMTLVELNLQGGRLQDAMTVSNDCFVTQERIDFLNRAHTIASVAKAVAPDQLPAYLLNALDLVNEASQVIPKGSKTTMGDSVRVILAKALSEKNQNIAESLISDMTALKEDTFALGLVKSVFGNKEEYSRLVVKALPQRQILLPELLGEFNQLNLDKQAKNHIISILVDDLEIMLKNNILPFTQGISQVLLDNKNIFSDRTAYFDRLIKAAIEGIKNGNKLSFGPLNNLLTNIEIHSLFGKDGSHLKDGVFLNWLSLISTGEPLEQSGH